MKQIYLLMIICLCASCSDNDFDVVGFNEKTQNSIQSISIILGIEKYERFYYLAKDNRDTLKIPSTEFEGGILYIKDILENDDSYSIILSNGEKFNILHTAESEIKYRIPNISFLRLDGYDIQLKIVLKDTNSLLRINHGEPGIGGLVCSSFIDFAKGTIGYYKPYSTEEEKTIDVLVESEQTIPFVEGHEYTIVSSKENGCIATIKVTDNDIQQTYQFTPDIGCYESGITNGWGKSSYEIKGEVDISGFKIYSNQDYHSKLLILGDSNADHGGIGDDKWRNYARQIKSRMGGSAFLVVQGGADTNDFITWLNEYVLNICKPQYCLVATYNEANFSMWYSNISEIIQIISDKGIIPILATIHPGGRNGLNDERKRINDWIRESGYLVFDIAKVISQNNDGITVNEELLRYDLVHFNYETNDMLADYFWETFSHLLKN